MELLHARLHMLCISQTESCLLYIAYPYQILLLHSLFFERQIIAKKIKNEEEERYNICSTNLNHTERLGLLHLAQHPSQHHVNIIPEARARLGDQYCHQPAHKGGGEL